MRKSHNMRHSKRERIYLPRVMHHRDFVKTRNAARFKGTRKRQHRHYSQPTNPSKYPEKGNSKMYTHHRTGTVASKMMQHARRNGGKTKSMVQRNSKNKSKRPTITSTAKKETEML